MGGDFRRWSHRAPGGAKGGGVARLGGFRIVKEEPRILLVLARNIFCIPLTIPRGWGVQPLSRGVLSGLASRLGSCRPIDGCALGALKAGVGYLFHDRAQCWIDARHMVEVCLG